MSIVIWPLEVEDMCLAIYIVSDHPLPTVATEESRPGFRVENGTDPHPLMWHFGQRFFYRARCHMGCGCGFAPCRWSWNEVTGENEVDDPPENHAARRGLADFLSAALRHQTAVEVYLCCSGDELQPPRHRRHARPADFTWDYTLFDVLGQVVVVSEQEEAEPLSGPTAGPQN